MRLSLFAKLFLWLWLVMVAIGAAFVVTQRYWAPMPPLPSDQELAETVEELQRLVAEHGMGAAMGYLRSLGRESGVRFFLLRADRPGPAARRLPEELRERIAGLAPEAAPVRGRGEALRYVAVPVPLAQQPPHLLLAVNRAAGWRELPAWLRGLIALAVSAALSAVLAGHLSRPLRRLREASRRLAAGDLAARVPVPAVGGDEISALGRDFNAMAARLEGLLAAQTRLLSDVSHELRSPLARIQVAVALVRRKAGTAVARPLEQMERDIQRLDELIGRVLQLVRLEQRATALRLQRVDLSALCASCVDDAAFEAEHEGKAVCAEVAPGLAVRGDPSLLRSALDNVLRNALHHTDPQVAVTLRAERQTNGVKIVVDDGGPGVPEAELGRIFEPFVRVSSARERESGGYGLGLAIVRRVVAAHGGTVKAENRPAGGLRVHLRLPLAPDSIDGAAGNGHQRTQSDAYQSP